MVVQHFRCDYRRRTNTPAPDIKRPKSRGPAADAFDPGKNTHMPQKNFVSTIIFMIVAELLIGILLLTSLPPYLMAVGMVAHIGLILRWMARNGAISELAEYAYWVLLVMGWVPTAA